MAEIQTDPSRCWVRIDSEDTVGDRTFKRCLIGDAWALEPFGPPGLPDEFSLAITVEPIREGPSLAPKRFGAGMRLDREAGTALRDALNQWLDRKDAGHPHQVKSTVECAHAWGPVHLDQTQACALCGTSRRHVCTFNCPAPHDQPSDEESTAFRQLFVRWRINKWARERDDNNG